MPKTKRASKTNVISFPIKSAVPVKNPDRVIKGAIIGNKLEDIGIKDGDDVVIDTFEAVGNGNLILISFREEVHLGFARFIGDGKVELHYGFEDGHESDTFKLSEIKIIGRVIKSERSWK